MEELKMMISALLIFFGVVFEIVSVFGIYKFNYVLPRMHAAAVGDTAALGLVISGLIVKSGFNMYSLKLFFVLVFFWVGSSVASHVVSRMVINGEQDEAFGHTDIAEAADSDL